MGVVPSVVYRMVTSGVVTAEEAYRYALSQPVATQVVGMKTQEHLVQNLKVARALVPMTAAEQQALVARVAEAARDGRHEPFKSTTEFDGPHHRRQHGFAA